MPNTVDALRPLVEAKVAESMKPLHEDAGNLRLALDAYLDASKKEHERRVLNALLAALGQPESPADSAHSAAEEALQTALRRMGALVSPPPAVLPQEAASPPYEPPSAPRVVEGPPPKPEPTPEDRKAIWAILNEIDSISKSDYRNENRTKLYHHIQALAAECRLWMAKLPPDNALADKLGGVGIRALGGIRGDSGMTTFVNGLGFGQKGDWAALAAEHRRKYENFVEPAPKPPPTPKVGTLGAKLLAALPVEKPKPEPEATHYEWPELPLLRAAIEDKPLLVVGKYRQDDEKLEALKERFGIEAEWAEVDHDSPRSVDAIATRVSKKIGAVIFLEGFMRHDTWSRISKVATTNSVPWAMADRGGIGSFEKALHDLEGKLTQAAKTG